MWEQAFGWSTRGIAVIDATTGSSESVNPAFAAMHGGSVDDFVGRHGDARPGARRGRTRCAELVEEARPRGTPLGHDRARAPGRQRVSRRDRGRSPPSTATDGRCTGCRGRRISASRRAAEAAHRETGAMFEAAFAYAPNGVAMIGLDGRFLRVNEALCAMLGSQPRPSSSGIRRSRSAIPTTSGRRMSCVRGHERRERSRCRSRSATCGPTARSCGPSAAASSCATTSERAELHRHPLRRLHGAQARRAPRGARPSCASSAPSPTRRSAWRSSTSTAPS